VALFAVLSASNLTVRLRGVLTVTVKVVVNIPVRPVAVLVAGVPELVTWIAGERALYESSAWRHRGFCRCCGTSLTWEAESSGAWPGLRISAFDEPEELPVSEHVFVMMAAGG